MTTAELAKEIASFDQSLASGLAILDALRTELGDMAFQQSMGGAYASSLALGGIPLPSARFQAVLLQLGMIVWLRALAERKLECEST